MWAFVPSRAHSFYGLGVCDYSATWRWSYQASVVCGQTRNVNTYGCFLKKFHHSNVCARTWHLLKMCICIKIMCNLHGCHCSYLAKCMTSNVVKLTQFGSPFGVSSSKMGNKFMWQISEGQITLISTQQIWYLLKYILALRVKKWDSV